MHVYRFRELVKLLDKIASDPLPTVGFNMSQWGGGSDTEACGTAACAMGTAALHPWFQKEGLSLTACMIDEYDNRETEIPIITLEQFNEAIKEDDYDDFVISYKGEEAFEAAAEFFGIEYDDAGALFHRRHPSYCLGNALNWRDRPNSTPAEVAAKIRTFVKEETGEEI